MWFIQKTIIWYIYMQRDQEYETRILEALKSGTLDEMRSNISNMGDEGLAEHHRKSSILMMKNTEFRDFLFETVN